MNTEAFDLTIKYSSGEGFCRTQKTSSNWYTSLLTSGQRNVVVSSLQERSCMPQQEKSALKSRQMVRYGVRN